MLMLQHVPDLVIGFAVVEFTENHSVGVVPSKWLANYNLTCFWPPYCAERLTASVRIPRVHGLNVLCESWMSVVSMYNLEHFLKLGVG